MRYVDPTGHQSQAADGTESAAAPWEFKAASTDVQEGRGFFARLGEIAGRASSAVKNWVGITEDGPVAGGDPTAAPEVEAAVNGLQADISKQVARIEAGKQQSVESGAQVGVIGKTAGQEILAASAVSDAAVLVTGRDINERESSRVWAAVSLATAGALGIVAKYGDRIPLLKRLFQRADDVAPTSGPITNPRRMLPAPSRPSPRQSELDLAAEYGWPSQQSFSQGRPTRYSARDSVRPDLTHPSGLLHLEGKNYDLATSGNRYNLYREIRQQAMKRAQDLPTGSHQGIVIDIRGQNVDPAVLQRIPRNIEEVTEGIIPRGSVIFKTE